MKNRLLLFIFLLPSLALFGQAGALDTSFGNGGKYIPQVGFPAKCVLQSDEKIISFGFIEGSGSIDTYFFYAARYFADGGLDSTFGTNGIGRIFAENSYDVAANCADVQADDKIVVAGSSNILGNHLLVARFNADGSVDSSFAGTGIKDISLPDPYSFNMSVKVLPNGKILLGGGIGTTNSDRYPYTVQLLPDGSLDNTYGVNGINTITNLGFSAFISDMAISVDGKAIAVLDHNTTNTLSQFYVLRLNTDGVPDNTFGLNGLITTPLNSISASKSVIIQDDNKIVAVGFDISNSFNQARLAMVRYLSDGLLDTTFGMGGKVIVNNTIYSLNISDIVIAQQPDHKLVVAGSSRISSTADFDFIIQRFNIDGTQDNTFGNNGYVNTDFNSANDKANAVFILHDGKILVTGLSASNFMGIYCIMARYKSCNINITGQPINITKIAGGTAQFIVYSSMLTATYQWQIEQTAGWENLSNNGQYSGVETAALTISNITMDNNLQKYRVIAFSGACSDTSVAAILKVEKQTAISEVNTIAGLKVYPNPAKNKLEIEIIDPKYNGLTYSIMDLTGRKMSSGKLQQAKNIVNLESISQGIYLLRIENSGTLNFVRNS